MNVNLPAWSRLTITADAESTGTYQRIGLSSDQPTIALSAGTVKVLGPFPEERLYCILSTSGEVSHAITEPVSAGVVIDGVTLEGGTVTARLPVSTLSADGAITIASGVCKITKSASAAALTLAAPTAAQEGTQITITSTTARAHTITATIQDGVTGGAKTTATFAAFAGASITLIAIGLEWNVVSANAVTVS